MNVNGSTTRESLLLAWRLASVSGLQISIEVRSYNALVWHPQCVNLTRKMLRVLCAFDLPQRASDSIRRFCADLLLPLKPCCKTLNQRWLQSAGGGGTAFDAMAVQERIAIAASCADRELRGPGPIGTVELPLRIQDHSFLC